MKSHLNVEKEKRSPVLSNALNLTVYVYNWNDDISRGSPTRHAVPNVVSFFSSSIMPPLRENNIFTDIHFLKEKFLCTSIAKVSATFGSDY